ncbi:MAG: pantoate--beta-alanine ligase [Gallionella sp.]|nr:pantoate--beta-alanine ligase [Gallionella sp.]
MLTLHTVGELRARLASEREVVFVPTMGNLHEGHIELVRLAQQYGRCVVVSIFVNPLQFGPSEDFERYPRTLEADCAKLIGLADVVFAPTVAEMYAQPQHVFVEPPPIANELCGAARPGHFRGMATVVLKLFNIVQPRVAIFGKKDYQQLLIIRQMVEQMNLPIRIIGGEIVRAADGLALSSRNQYLNANERAEAPHLYQLICEIREAWLRDGLVAAELVRQRVLTELAERAWVVDYISLRKLDTLAVAEAGDGCGVVLVAAKQGVTRLLDNVEVLRSE